MGQHTTSPAVIGTIVGPLRTASFSAQEIEKTLFFVSSLSHLKGRWQMVGQGEPFSDLQGSIKGPLGMRHACSTFLEFAALAVQHQQQPYCAPVSPQEKVG